MNSVDEYETDDETAFISKLLGEMKNQFNKTETRSAKTNENCLETGQSEDTKVKLEMTISEVKVEENFLGFKTPKEQSLSPEKDSPPSKKQSKKRSIIPHNTTLKRSSRRRSRDNNESVLQSAIARKEKSYNESNKPQRLTRQLKPTQKVLENIASAKEKIKIKKNCDGQNTDDEIANKYRKEMKRIFNKPKVSATESEMETDCDDSTSDDSEVDVEILVKSTRRSSRISISQRNEDYGTISSLNLNLPDQIDDIPEDSKFSVVEVKAPSTLCFCTKKTTLYADSNNLGDSLFCNAIDSIEGKLIGCSRAVNIRDTCLLRPSQRVPYQVFCEMHQNRLLRHNCCPACGIFCSQGKFAECHSKHQYHRDCPFSSSPNDFCPHCGATTLKGDVHIRLECAKKPVFLPVQKLNYPSARMTFTSVNGESISEKSPLLPAEMFQNLNECQAGQQEFTEGDLLEAVRDGNSGKLAAIIASDCVDVHFKLADFNDGTLLHYASQNGLLGICHLLLYANLEIDDFDKEQNTPLMLAISAGHIEVVRYLIRSGASISVKGTDGMTSLHVAAKCGNLAAAKLILNSASCTIRDFVNCQDDGGWTPLVWSCEHGHLDVAQFFIAQGADPFLRDVEHNEALHWAAFSGNSAMVQLLLDQGCDVNTVNAHGENPLHIAAREDQHNCIIVLLARGADVCLLNKNNETPLDCVPEDGESYSVMALNLRLQAKSDFKMHKTILSNDISNGREINPIQCVNRVDQEPVPTDYVYVTKNCTNSDNVNIDRRVSTLRSCKCRDRCTTDECECGRLSVKCLYDEDGRLTGDFNFTDAPMIFECSYLCSCNVITCRNRTVQRGLTQRFQLFKTEAKGWGVRTLRRVARRSYVCEYIGEILTDIEADSKEDDSFVFDISTCETGSFCVDARHYGNLSRFINHSCDPNLYPVKVFVEHQDLRFPRIALFALRDIVEEEELSFDYGQKFWSVKYKSFTCQCGSHNCRYSEVKIEDTLTASEEKL